MRTHIIVAVYDKAVSAYMRPFVAQSSGQAIRMFIDEATRTDSDIGKHPEDYAIFKIADFNEKDGKITGVEPVCLQRAHEIPTVKLSENTDSKES